MPTRIAVQVFLSFAFAYFFSALVRGVTATLAPSFSAEMGLAAGDLGLLWRQTLTWKGYRIHRSNPQQQYQPPPTLRNRFQVPKHFQVRLI